MARTNVRRTPTEFTHEGAPVRHSGPYEQLRRAVSSCLLGEDTFYEGGQTLSARIMDLALSPKVPVQKVVELAEFARHDLYLRHVPLFLLVALMKRTDIQGKALGDVIYNTISRADEMAELIALYWGTNGDGAPLAKQLRVALARKFHDFDPYQFAKYRGNKNAITLRDVMFMVHPNPGKSKAKTQLFKDIAEDTLAPADTWEVGLSAGKDKAEVFGKLLEAGKMGHMAILRNLRNMAEASMPCPTQELLRTAPKSKALPFRYIAAAQAVPQWEQGIEPAMLVAAGNGQSLEGNTAILIDNSGSMRMLGLSAKSQMHPADAAAGLAILLRELCPELTVVSFGTVPILVPSRRGFALRDAIRAANTAHGTNIGQAVASLANFTPGVHYDRVIVVTDGQSMDRVPAPRKGTKAYMLIVGPYRNTVGYGPWNTIHGWSNAVVRWIQDYEGLETEG